MTREQVQTVTCGIQLSTGTWCAHCGRIESHRTLRKRSTAVDSLMRGRFFDSRRLDIFNLHILLALNLNRALRLTLDRAGPGTHRKAEIGTAVFFCQKIFFDTTAGRSRIPPIRNESARNVPAGASPLRQHTPGRHHALRNPALRHKIFKACPKSVGQVGVKPVHPARSTCGTPGCVFAVRTVAPPNPGCPWSK
jgi:hypothetical protein